MSIRHCEDWFVPVRCVREVAVVRVGRLADGTPVGIAFSTLSGLRAASGVQEWMRLSEGALRDLLEPLGISRIQLDPSLVAVPVKGVVAS